MHCALSRELSSAFLVEKEQGRESSKENDSSSGSGAGQLQEQSSVLSESGHPGVCNGMVMHA